MLKTVKTVREINEDDFRHHVRNHHDRLSCSEMHAAVEAEYTDIQDEEAAAVAARKRSCTLTTVPIEAEVWYNTTRDVFHIRHSWFSKDGNGYSTDLEDACHWFDRTELEAIRTAELAAVAATPE